MTQVAFSEHFHTVRISGHSGYAEEGSDIVCAAISSMVNYFCNAAEAFGAQADILTDEREGLVIWKLLSPNPDASRLASVLYGELKELETRYPQYVRVIKSERE
jgi:hypothetical protein